MIENKSVKILTKIKVIWIVLIAAATVAFFILGIISAVQAPDDGKAAAVISLIFGTIGMCISGYLIYLLLDFCVNRRQENINYMNARLTNKDNDKEVK